MNSSSIPVSIIWSRMNQNIDSTLLSVDVEEIGIPELERCTLNTSPSNHNRESFSSPVLSWYLDFENKAKFLRLILAHSVVCAMFPPGISNFIVDIACWSWTTCWNLNNPIRIILAITVSEIFELNLHFCR